jgi:serine/threonine protein phosphatase PrpC
MPEIDFFQLSDIGCARTENEDSIGHWAHDDGLLFAVADGLGGHAAGEEASAFALQVLAREMENAPPGWAISKRLRRAVQEANLQVHTKGITVPELRGMGTTITATAIVGGTLYAAHVGDTRLYMLRDGKFEQLTKDHTWVAEQVQYGILTPEEARTHPRKNVLVRCLGPSLIVGVDVLTIDVMPGDALLQCSDGVHGVMEDAELHEFLELLVPRGGPEAVCRTVVERVLERGGEDNLSVQVAVVVNCSAPAPRPWWRFGS